MQSNRHILNFEGELRQCCQQYEAAQKMENQFDTFSEDVKDYAFITFDVESRIVSWSRGTEQASIDVGPSLQQLLNELIGFNKIDQKRIQIQMEADDVVLSSKLFLLVSLSTSLSPIRSSMLPGRQIGTVVICFRYLAETVPFGKVLDTNGVSSPCRITKLESMTFPESGNVAP